MKMTADGWEIPARLQRLLAAGKWPRDVDEETAQYRRPPVPLDHVHRFAPEERDIYLLCPPFKSAAQRIRSGERFWEWEQAAPGEISFNHAVVIGDFGIGSDAPVILDYRLDPRQPCVLRLRYDFVPGPRPTTITHWVGVAQSFDDFADLLGL